MGYCYYQDTGDLGLSMSIAEVKHLSYEPYCNLFVVTLDADTFIVTEIGSKEAAALIDGYFRDGKLDLREVDIEVITEEALFTLRSECWHEISRIAAENYQENEEDNEIS